MKQMIDLSQLVLNICLKETIVKEKIVIAIGRFVKKYIIK